MIHGFTPDVDLNNIKAPINKGDVVGKISYSIDDINYTTNLIAGQDIYAIPVFVIAIRIAGIILILIIVKCILNIFRGGNSKKKRKKGRHMKKKDNYYNTSFYKF